NAKIEALVYTTLNQPSPAMSTSYPTIVPFVFHNTSSMRAKRPGMNNWAHSMSEESRPPESQFQRRRTPASASSAPNGPNRMMLTRTWATPPTPRSPHASHHIGVASPEAGSSVTARIPPTTTAKATRIESLDMARHLAQHNAGVEGRGGP